jgi:predicted nucleotidyltransferase component of viral defense system
MQDLIQQERFEIEVLDRLNTGRLLGNILFGGGTMLRLCFGLNRFSVDLDFWIVNKTDINALFKGIKQCLAEYYSVRDSKNKFYTMVFEVKSIHYPRSLKIEVRKETKKVACEQAIAFSRYSSEQVLLNVISLREMMKLKIEAFLSRREIRDVFDIEFLFKRGIPFDAPPTTLAQVIKGIDGFTKKDYTVKLGSLLEEDQRKYYRSENFKILRSAIESLRRNT